VVGASYRNHTLGGGVPRKKHALGSDALCVASWMFWIALNGRESMTVAFSIKSFAGGVATCSANVTVSANAGALVVVVVEPVVVVVVVVVVLGCRPIASMK
jgi:hypothetical protein